MRGNPESHVNKVILPNIEDCFKCSSLFVAKLTDFFRFSAPNSAARNGTSKVASEETASVQSATFNDPPDESNGSPLKRHMSASDVSVISTQVKKNSNLKFE